MTSPALSPSVPSDTHGQFVDHRRTAQFVTRIGDQDFIVQAAPAEIDVDVFTCTTCAPATNVPEPTSLASFGPGCSA